MTDPSWIFIFLKPELNELWRLNLSVELSTSLSRGNTLQPAELRLVWPAIFIQSTPPVYSYFHQFKMYWTNCNVTRPGFLRRLVRDCSRATTQSLGDSRLVVTLPTSRFVSLIGCMPTQWHPEVVSSSPSVIVPRKSKLNPKEPNQFLMASQAKLMLWKAF